MPRARNTDPVTSDLAAESVRQVTATQTAILNLLGIPSTDQQLVERYRQEAASNRAPRASESGIRTRRAELVERGLVEDSGYRVRTEAGRHAIVWHAIKVAA